MKELKISGINKILVSRDNDIFAILAKNKVILSSLENLVESSGEIDLLNDDEDQDSDILKVIVTKCGPLIGGRFTENNVLLVSGVI